MGFTELFWQELGYAKQVIQDCFHPSLNLENLLLNSQILLVCARQGFIFLQLFSL